MTDVQTAARDVFALPGNAVFPESVGVDPRDGAAYVGSLADGTLYRAKSPRTVEIVSAGGTDGRGSVAGVKFDALGPACGQPADMTARCLSTQSSRGSCWPSSTSAAAPPVSTTLRSAAMVPPT